MRRIRRRQKKKRETASPEMAASWLEPDGFHALIPSGNLSPEALDQASKNYQKSIRESPLWDEMVQQFGEQEAERMLLEFRVQIR